MLFLLEVEGLSRGSLILTWTATPVMPFCEDSRGKGFFLILISEFQCHRWVGVLGRHVFSRSVVLKRRRIDSRTTKRIVI